MDGDRPANIQTLQQHQRARSHWAADCLLHVGPAGHQVSRHANATQLRVKSHLECCEDQLLVHGVDWHEHDHQPQDLQGIDCPVGPNRSQAEPRGSSEQLAVTH